MSSNPDTNEMTDRLEQTERQVRRLRTAVWVLAILVVAVLIPPIRAVLGVILGVPTLVLLIVGPVLLFIGLVMRALDRVSQQPR